MIGSPIIADIIILPGGIGVITGKGYGATNIIVMDPLGAVLMETSIEVKGPRDPIVAAYSGVNRSTYSCPPDCQPRITLDDHADEAGGTGSNPSDHYVEPYVTKNGTPVAGHYQTNPNNTQTDNYDTKGNVNPHTGEVGTRNPKY